MYCGDDDDAKGVAAELIRDVGFDPVDAGPLRIARYTEPFALLVGQLATREKAARSWRTGSSGSGIRMTEYVDRLAVTKVRKSTTDATS